MASFDEIKKKLNIDELDKETRNSMFNKFVEKGGKVIEEKSGDGSKSKNRPRVIQTNLQRKQDEISKKHALDNTSKNLDSSQSKNKKIKRYFSVYLNGFLQNLFSLSNKFSPKFSQNIQNELPEILSFLNYTAGLLLSLEPEKKWQAYDILSKNTMNSSFEILMRVYNLYKISSINRIQSYVKKFGNIVCPEISDDINQIFRELLIIHPFWETIKDVLYKSAVVYQQVTGKDPYIKKQKISQSVETLLGYFFPHFHTILNYNFGKRVPFDYQEMVRAYEIAADEEFGSYSKDLLEERKMFIEQLKKEKEERKKLLEESIEKKEMEKIPKYVLNGLQIIDRILDRIDNYYKDDPRGNLMEKNEKMFHFYALYKEFDYEYSFILTTSQIRLTARSESGKRIDIKSEFEELNIKYNEINSFVREYLSLVEQNSKVIDEFKNNPLGQQQKKSLLMTKRTQTLNEIRARSSIFFKKFAISLQKLINDYNTDKLLLQNGDEVLHFQKDLGEKRKFENIPIIKVIATAFSFASALHYYISVGKLSSKSLYLDEEKKGDQTENPVETVKNTEQPKEQ